MILGLVSGLELRRNIVTTEILVRLLHWTEILNVRIIQLSSMVVARLLAGMVGLFEILLWRLDMVILWLVVAFLVMIRLVPTMVFLHLMSWLVVAVHVVLRCCRLILSQVLLDLVVRPVRVLGLIVLLNFIVIFFMV